jgi:hypothetical protein
MAADDAGQAGKPSAQVGQPFMLKLGAAATVEAEDLQVGFDHVVSDSRCPTGAQCIQEGEAVVRIWLVKTPAQRDTRDVATTPQRDTGTYGAYRVKLVSLEPHPNLKQATRASDYVATLLVTRN